jgi:hypothetical protein
MRSTVARRGFTTFLKAAALSLLFGSLALRRALE